MDALQRVLRDGHSSSSSMSNQEQLRSKMLSLADLGAQKVVNLVVQYASAESKPIDLLTYMSSGKRVPSLTEECITSIKALLQFLSTMPDSQNKSDHAFVLALQSFAQVRAAYLTSSMEPMTRAVVNSANAVQRVSVDAPREAHAEYRRGSAPFADWFKAMISTIQAEQEAATMLFQGMSWKNMYSSTISNILQPLLSSVHDQLPIILPRLEHGLKAHRFLVLDFLSASHAVLGSDCRNWDSALQYTSCSSSVLTNAVVSSQKTALLFFPEFLRDIKVIPVQREHDVLQVGVSGIARFGMKLFQGLSEYPDVTLRLMGLLGSKNWTSDASGGQGLMVPQDLSPAENLQVEYARDMLASITSSIERTLCFASYSF